VRISKEPASWKRILKELNLLEAVGLTDNALREAFGDARTKLPAGITRPKAWPPLEIEVG
jgi:hypothetical protein